MPHEPAGMLPAEDLIADVAAAEGLEAALDPASIDGLERLLWSMANEADLNEIGNLAADGIVRQYLRNRIRVDAWWRHHPELDEQHVEAPLILVGVARSGTTALSHLLGIDPQWRSLRQWEATDSVPPPTTEGYDTDPRFEAARVEDGAGMAALNPDFRAIHEDPPEAPIECVTVLSQTFASLLYSTVFHLPSYTEWITDPATDLTFTIDYHRRVLALLQSQCPGPWQLKTPQHAIALTELRAAYPDATFVATHRDPAVCTASVASLFASLGNAMRNEARPHANGREAINTIGPLADGLVAHAEAHGHDALAHIDYETLRTDRLGVVRDLYDHIGAELTDDTAAAMQHHIDDRPQGKHGRHAYTAADFGLDQAELDERFAAYRSTFGLG